MSHKKDKYQEMEEEENRYIEIDKTDDDLLQNPQKEFQGGIETEEYDVLPQLDEHTEIKDELETKECIAVAYSFNGQEVKEGLGIYQATTIYKRNMIYSGILLIVFFLYMMNIIKNPDEVFSIFLAVMCVAVLAFIWILPKSHINKTAKAADSQKLNFSMKIYDNCIQIGEDGGSFILAYDKEITAIYETPNLYLVCAGKERIFILPKRCLSQEESDSISTTFKTAIKQRYIQKL